MAASSRRYVPPSRFHRDKFHDGVTMSVMDAVGRINLLLWTAFYVYWLISALGVKKRLRGARHGVAIRALIGIVIYILFIRSGGFRYLNLAGVAFSSVIVRAMCLLFCTLGLALAVWARIYLGSNWGTPMSLREGHELVTSGPYRFIRHPIYTGILLAMLASAGLAGPIWLAAFIFFGGFFVYSAKTEERLMAEQFPTEYPEYKRRSKRLIPFVW